jgi:hypothetical protein
MQNRWGVLALVVVARTAMGFQFQSIAAVGSFLVADLGLSYAQLGTLIGRGHGDRILGPRPRAAGSRLGGGRLWSALVEFLVAPAAGGGAGRRGLAPWSRNTGFGLFYAPPSRAWEAGRQWPATWSIGTAGAAALWLAAAVWLAAWPALGLFRALQGRWTPARTA